MRYVGVDVSKASLDVFLDGRRFAFSNSALGFAALLRRLLSGDVAVLESTGGYERACAAALREAGFAVAIANPLEVSHFRRGLGKRAKTDLIDAEVLARFGQTRELQDSGAEQCPEFRDAVSRRAQLVSMLAQEKQHLEHARGIARESVQRHMVQLDSEITAMNKLIEQIVASDTELRAKSEVLRGIKCIGPTVAAVMLAEMPELGTLSRKQAAALAGVAPFARESGQWQGKRSIFGGRELVRRMLYMAAMTGRTWNSTLAEFYAKLRAAGKPVKVALIACARKLLVIANAKLRDARGQPRAISAQ
jgi:transposase